MKILYYSPHPNLNLSDPAGYGTHMREMITAFERSGHETLPVIMGGIHSSDKECADNAKRRWIDFIKPYIGKRIWQSLKDFKLLAFDRRAAKTLEQKIKSFQPDFIYERANYLQLSGIKMANKYNIQHVLEVNAPFLEENKVLTDSKSYLETLARRREKLQAENTDRLVTVSEALKDYYIKAYNVPEEKMIITPNAINKKAVSLDSGFQNEVKRKYGLNDTTVIGFVGSIFKWHGVDLLIEAFNKINEKKTKLLIVGYGEYLKELKQLAENLERRDDIIFTGKVEKEAVFNFISIMDICVSANAEWYQSPIKIFEYGALGKPIIAPDVSPVREVMEDGRDGLLVAPSIDSILDALNIFLNDTAKARQMGKEFQQKILAEFTWDHNAERVLKAIE